MISASRSRRSRWSSLIARRHRLLAVSVRSSHPAAQKAERRIVRIRWVRVSECHRHLIRTGKRPGCGAARPTAADAFAAQGPKVCRLFAGGRWIRTFSTVEDDRRSGRSRRLSGCRKISQRRHEAVLEKLLVSRRTEVSNLVFLPAGSQAKSAKHKVTMLTV